MTAQQLKNSILQMAVQGKLVPQDPADEPASVLLERIRAEKKQLVKAGKIKKEKNPSRIFRGADNLLYEKVGENEPVCIADKVPFEIPESWEWVRIGTIFVLQAGKNISASDISESNFDGAYLCYGGNGVRGYVKSYNREGDYPIIGRQGALCGNVKYAKGKFYATEHAVCVETFAQTNVEWACAFLEALNLNQYATATAQPGLAVANINTILIPIPPKKEQQRIVDVLISLQPFIEFYTKKECELNSLHQHFSDLLKKSILQEAVQGKLVPQDPNDEPASVLLERIRAEKEQLIKVGKIKHDKHESIIFRRDDSHYEKLDGIERCIDDEIPFEIPEKWVWARFGTTMINRDAERIPLSVNEREQLHKIYDYYGASGVIDKVDRYLFSKPLLLIGEDGANLLTRSKPIAFIARGQYWVNNHAHVLDSSDGLLLEYVAAYINAINLAPYVTGTAQPKMNQEKMNSILIPIPPASEQFRIVQKIEQILSVIANI